MKLLLVGFVILVGGGIIPELDCDGGGYGSGGGPFSIYKGYEDSWYEGDGTYGLKWKLTGHSILADGASQQTFTVLRSNVLLQELCAPGDLEDDWNEAQNVNDSPHSEDNYGGYATPAPWELWVCSAGQAVFWTWSFEWANADPFVEHQLHSGFRCRVLRGFTENTYGWCQD